MPTMYNKIILSYLLGVSEYPTETVNVLTADHRRTYFPDVSCHYQEETFVQHSQERIMGLLGAIVMLNEDQIDADCNILFTTVDFLRFIFYIARWVKNIFQRAAGSTLF